MLVVHNTACYSVVKGVLGTMASDHYGMVAYSALARAVVYTPQIPQEGSLRRVSSSTLSTSPRTRWPNMFPTTVQTPAFVKYDLVLLSFSYLHRATVFKSERDVVVVGSSVALAVGMKSTLYSVLVHA